MPAATKKKAAPKKTSAKKPAAKKAPPKPKLAVRNRTNCQYAFRTDEMQDKKKRIELKPRGERGDLYKLKPGQEKDDEVQAGITYGILEIITHAEADSVQEKQATNRQAHPAEAMLVNEYGEEIEFTGSMPSFEQQGVVVAELIPGEGGTGEVLVDRQGIRRTLPREGEEVQQGPRRFGEQRSPIVTQAQPRRRGPRVTGQQPPVQVPRGREGEAAADAKARIKGLGGPAAGVPDGTKVVLTEPVKT